MESPHVATWERIRHWDLVLPPSRPSVYHLHIVREVTRNIDRMAPVAVLGSTPELRDLLFFLGFHNVHIFEKSKASYIQMNQLRCSLSSETLILGDWVETLPNYTDYFALILSDLTSGNIEYERQPIFYSAIASALHKKGMFVDKILTLEAKKWNLDSLIEKYSTLPVNLMYVNHFSCEFLFCSELLDIKQMVDSTLFYELLRKEFRTDVLKKFLSEAPKITPYDTIWFYGKEWSEISKWYYQHMKPVKFYDEEKGSPYHKYLKIIINTRISG